MQSTRRGLHCISRHGDTPPLRDDEGVDPSALCRTSYSTEVAHVGQPVQQDEEGRASLLIEERDELLE